MGARWESAFVAISALLGEPLDCVLGELGDGAVHADRLIRALRSSERNTRVRELAHGLSHVAMALRALGLP
jgi:hypothetical protein